MQPVTYQFLDWARAKIAAHLDGILSPDLIFDEREDNLMQTIQQNIAKGLGICIALSLPQLSQVGNLADDTQYICSCAIGILQNRALHTAVDGCAIAEDLFRMFAGSEFQCGSRLAIDVKADSLSHTTVGTKKSHEFVIYTTVTI